MAIPTPEVLRELMSSTSLVDLISTSPVESPFQAAVRRDQVVYPVKKTDEPFFWFDEITPMSRIWFEPETNEVHIQIIPPGVWVNPDPKLIWIDGYGQIHEVQ